MLYSAAATPCRAQCHCISFSGVSFLGATISPPVCPLVTAAAIVRAKTYDVRKLVTVVEGDATEAMEVS